MDNPLARLHRLIVERLSLSDLRTLCFNLGINYDDLPGEAMSDKTRELILEMGRRRQLEHLLTDITQTRPDLAEEPILRTDPAALDTLYDWLPKRTVKPLSIPSRRRIWPWVVVAVLTVAVTGGIFLLTGGYQQLFPSDNEPTVVDTASHPPTSTPESTATLRPAETPTPTVTPPPSPTLTPEPVLLTRAPTTQFYFQDEFDGPNLGGHWSVDGPRDLSQVRIEGGALHLEGGGKAYPLVSMTNPFPTDRGFTLELRFRYVTVTLLGVGFAAADEVPPRGWDVAVELRFLGVWQDSSKPLRIHSDGDQLWELGTNDTAWHVIKLRYDRNQYELTVDGDLVSSFPRAASRPTTLWFGNTVELETEGMWSVLEVDYIRVISTD